MSTSQHSTPVDGRAARRERNINAVLDTVLEMFAEDALFPTMEQVATRSGLSLRSLYRYFADPAELLEAAISHAEELASELSQLPASVGATLDQRIDDFVAMRLGLYETAGPIYRATTANAERHDRVREVRAKNRDRMREQFEAQFAPELQAMTSPNRKAAIAMGDVATQMQSIDYLLRHRGLSPAEVGRALRFNLLALLS